MILWKGIQEGLCWMVHLWITWCQLGWLGPDLFQDGFSTHILVPWGYSQETGLSTVPFTLCAVQHFLMWSKKSYFLHGSLGCQKWDRKWNLPRLRNAQWIFHHIVLVQQALIPLRFTGDNIDPQFSIWGMSKFLAILHHCLSFSLGSFPLCFSLRMISFPGHPSVPYENRFLADAPMKLTRLIQTPA